MVEFSRAEEPTSIIAWIAWCPVLCVIAGIGDFCLGGVGGI